MGLVKMRWGWGPLRPGNAPRTLYGEARNSRAEGTRKTKRPESQGSKEGRQQAGPRLNGKLALSGGGRCVGDEGTGTEPNPAPVGAAEQSLQLVPGAVVCSGGGEGPGSRASCPRGKLLLLSVAKEQAALRSWSLLLLRGLLGDALLFLLQFLGSAP